MRIAQRVFGIWPFSIEKRALQNLSALDLSWRTAKNEDNNLGAEIELERADSVDARSGTDYSTKGNKTPQVTRASAGRAAAFQFHVSRQDRRLYTGRKRLVTLSWLLRSALGLKGGPTDLHHPAGR